MSPLVAWILKPRISLVLKSMASPPCRGREARAVPAEQLGFSASRAGSVSAGASAWFRRARRRGEGADQPDQGAQPRRHRAVRADQGVLLAIGLDRQLVGHGVAEPRIRRRGWLR